MKSATSNQFEREARQCRRQVDLELNEEDVLWPLLHALPGTGQNKAKIYVPAWIPPAHLSSPNNSIGPSAQYAQATPTHDRATNWPSPQIQNIALTSSTIHEHTSTTRHQFAELPAGNGWLSTKLPTPRRDSALCQHCPHCRSLQASPASDIAQLSDSRQAAGANFRYGLLSSPLLESLDSNATEVGSTPTVAKTNKRKRNQQSSNESPTLSKVRSACFISNSS
jgi:hypothetical protein